MQITFRKEKYTLLFIPESGKSVVSFRVPRIVIVSILAVVVALFITVYVLQSMNADNAANLKSIHHELSVTEKELGDTTDAKNTQIQMLQDEIETLTRQAEEIKSKVNELKRLEEQLRLLMGDVVSNATEEMAAAAIAEAIEISEHQGGLFYPVEELPEAQIEPSAAADFTELEDQVEQLIASLTNVKNDIHAFLHKISITPSIFPTDSKRITSEFGTRTDPFDHILSHHTGIDIGGAYNAKVYATADGVVDYAGSDSGKGNHVTLDHSNGLQTKYMHLSKYVVKRNQNVKKGEVIGYIGSTGRSTGPHLHYEVIKNGKPVDPMPYLSIFGKSGMHAEQ